MNEIEQLKKRIDDSRYAGIETAIIRDDYEPVGDLMIQQLVGSGEYVARKTPAHNFDQKWRIFHRDFEPYC